MGTLKYTTIPVTPFAQNCSLVWDSDSRDGALIDAGGEPARLMQAVEQHEVTLTKLLVTHGHLDHVGAVASLARELQLPIEGPQREDRFWIDMLPQLAAQYGFPPADAFTPTRWLDHGDVVEVGAVRFDVLHCPGHTPGHVVLFEPESRVAFVGDVLFAGSIGRTDFPRGDYDTLITAIRERLFPLGDDVRFVPGHGPESTFGHERQTNPFVADQRFG